jgi:hypothetical protein
VEPSLDVSGKASLPIKVNEEDVVIPNPDEVNFEVIGPGKDAYFIVLGKHVTISFCQAIGGKWIICAIKITRKTVQMRSRVCIVESARSF